MNIMLDPGAFMPERAHNNDAGLDLFSPVDCLVCPGCRKVIDTGVHVQIPYGFVGMVTSKSGLMAKYGITSTGTIDCDYSGSIKAVLINHGSEIFHVEKGMKITQLVITPCLMPHLEVVDSFPETERGVNGFGSTGSKYRAKSYFDLCHDQDRERRNEIGNDAVDCQTDCDGENGCCVIDYDLIDKKLKEAKSAPEIMDELNGTINDTNGLFGQMGIT